MRGFLVKFVGFALYVHDLQSGTLTLTHQRPNRKPAEYVLNEEDFEDSAGELDDETVATLEPGIEASAVGLSLRLIKNDGVLKATFESEHHGVADWTFHGLRGSNAGRMTACTFTQTASETSAGCMCTGILPPELSNSTIQIVSTNPIPERIIQPPASGLSIISTTETRPLKRKATEDMDQPKPHKRAKSSHDSVPWPNHLYMTCLRTKPIHKSDIGTLHIDLIEGTVWFEGWYGKPNARTYEKKQIDLCDPSTNIQYLYHDDNDAGTDKSTHHLKITKINEKFELETLFLARCSAYGWQIWGSDRDTSPDPNSTTFTSREGYRIRNARLGRNIPSSLPDNTTTKDITPTVIVDAIVHCIDRATQRQPIHDPETEHKLDQDYGLLILDQASEEPSEEADKRYVSESKKFFEWMERSNQHRTVHDLERSRYRRTKGGSAK